MTEEDKHLWQFGWIPVVYDDAKAMMPLDGDRVMCICDYRPMGGYRVTNFFYYDPRYGFVNEYGDDDPYGGITHWMPLSHAERHLHSVYLPDDEKPRTMFNPDEEYSNHKFWMEFDNQYSNT